jgi:hypothetical protein
VTVTVTVTMTMAVAMAVCVTAGKPRLCIVDPGSEALDHVPNMFDFVTLGLQSINFSDYTPHPGDFRVCILYRAPCAVVARLDGSLCRIL